VPVFTKLDRNHPSISFSSNEVECSSPRGDNSKKVEIHYIPRKKSPEPVLTLTEC
jgi:hypothetical protein